MVCETARRYQSALVNNEGQTGSQCMLKKVTFCDWSYRLYTTTSIQELVLIKHMAPRQPLLLDEVSYLESLHLVTITPSSVHAAYPPEALEKAKTCPINWSYASYLPLHDARGCALTISLPHPTTPLKLPLHCTLFAHFYQPSFLHLSSRSTYEICLQPFFL